ncbi:hypothetical protein KGQ72_00825 [Patescibacteria group bacterium]|nr:hypothetical protein [Patescibacteria group bacterium]
MTTNLESARQLAQRAREWLQTPEGQQAMEEAGRRVQETCEQLEKCRRINRKDLYEPFTI